MALWLTTFNFACGLQRPPPPTLTTPGEALGESVNLIVMATRECEQFSDEFLQPSGPLGKAD